MKDDLSKKCGIEQQQMRDRYVRAQKFNQGMFDSSVARNSSLYPVWIEGSNNFWYERATKHGKEIRLVDAESGTNEAAFNHKDLAEALTKASGQEVDSKNLPVNDLAAKKPFNLQIFLHPLRVHFTAYSRRWKYTEQSSELVEVEQISSNWLFSPDGRMAAFRKETNIWVRDLNTGEERALTDDGEEFYQYGVPAPIWTNDMPAAHLPVQAAWSPDSKQLFTVQMDQRQVKSLGEIQHVPLDGSLRPKTSMRKVSFPEDEHMEAYRLVVIDVENGGIKDVEYRNIPVSHGGSGGFFENSMGWWGDDSKQLYFVDVDRYYKYARVVACNSDTGATRIIFEEASETRIDLTQDPMGALALIHPLPETNELLWISERSGWAHFYLYDLNLGALKRAVTSGDWMVHELVYFDEVRRELFLSTSGRVKDRNPHYRDLIRVNIDTGEIFSLTDSDHEYVTISKTAFWQYHKGYAGVSSGVSPTGDYAVVSRSKVDEKTKSYLMGRNGDKILELEEADISLPEGWVWPEVTTVTAAEGETDIYVNIFRPSNFDPNKSYPIIDQSTIGHGMPVLAKSSFRTGPELFFFEAASLAELGFIVVQIDGRGSAFKNKASKSSAYGWKDDFDGHLDDHVAAIKQLGDRYSYMNLDRVGIVGLQVGGNGAVRGMLEYPDFFKVGVAGEIFDQRLIASNSGDMYEGLVPNSDRKYLEDVVVQLKGKLLIMAGLMDFIPAATSLRVVEALQRADKDFDFILEPNGGYGGTPYQVRRAWDYLICHLQEGTPPKEFKLNELPRAVA